MWRAVIARAHELIDQCGERFLGWTPPPFEPRFYADALGIPAPDTIGAVLTLAGVGMQFNLPSGDDSGDFWNFASAFEITVVPEPATALLTGLGLVGLAVAARRRRV